MNYTNESHNKRNKSLKYSRQGQQEPIFKNILEYYFQNGTFRIKYVNFKKITCIIVPSGRNNTKGAFKAQNYN